MSSPLQPGRSLTPDLADRVLFYVLAVVLCARPMIGESYERLEFSFLSALGPDQGPTPAATVWLDTFVLTAAALALARRGRWRAHWPTALGLILLAAAVAVSSSAADNKYLARFAGSSLLIGVLAIPALRVLIQARWMWHLLLAGLLATGGTTAGQCLRQYTAEYATLRQEWEQVSKPQLLKQGYDLTDPLIVSFERRLNAREPDGFLAHPNVTGSCLMIWLLLAAGLAASQFARLRRGPAAGAPRSGPPPALAAVIALAVFALFAISMPLTGSRGAIGGAAVGLVALLFFAMTATWSAGHARRLLALLAAVYLAGIGATAALGLARGTLPNASLAFRWRYWTAAAAAYAEAPLTGIGRGNFATAYLRHKDAEATEEVRDPHDLWISLLVELGPLGLTGGALLAGVGVLAAVRRLDPAGPAGSTDARPDSTAPPNEPADWPRCAAPLILGVPALHAVFSATQFDVHGMPLVWAVYIAATWIAGFALTLWLLNACGDQPQVHACLVATLGATLLAALTHALIDFALLTPGGLAVFALCVAAAAGAPPYADSPPRGATGQPARWPQVVANLVALFVIVVQCAVATVPVGTTTNQMRHLEAALQAPPDAGTPTLPELAADLAVHSPDPAVARTAIRTLLQIGRAPKLTPEARVGLVEQAVNSATSLVQRIPRDTANYALLALAQTELAAAHEQSGHTAEAARLQQTTAETWDSAVRYYPTNPRTRISAGTAWFDVWKRTGAPDAARRAREHFTEALRIDDLRPVFEVARLRPKDRQPAEERLRELASVPTTAP